MSETIFLRVGNREAISLDLFISSLSNFLGALQDIDATISKDEQGSLVWEVVVLQKNSPALIGVRPRQRARYIKLGIADYSGVVEEQFIENARLLNNKAERNDYLSDAALKRIESLARKSKGIGPMVVYQSDNGAGTPKNEIVISEKTFENVKKLTSVRYSAFSSIRGNLDSISVHRSNEFKVWDEITHKPITCRFPDSKFEDVRSLLKKRVTVSGILDSNVSGSPISILVEDLSFTPERPLPTIDEMCGYVHDFTNGKTLKEYMEELSDE